MAHYKKGCHGRRKTKREHRIPDGLSGRAIRTETRKRNRKSLRRRSGRWGARSKGYNG